MGGGGGGEEGKEIKKGKIGKKRKKKGDEGRGREEERKKGGKRRRGNRLRGNGTTDHTLERSLCSLTTGAMVYLELFNGEFKFIVTPPLVPFSGENSL